MPRRKGTATGRLLTAPAPNGLEERVTSPDGTETAAHRSPLTRGLKYTVMMAAASLVIITSLAGSGAKPTAAQAANQPGNRIEYSGDYSQSEPQGQTGLEGRIISHESTPVIYMQTAATATATATRPPTSPIGFAFWPLSKKVKLPDGKEGELAQRITSYLDLDPTDGIRRWDGASVNDPTSYEIFTLPGHAGIDIQPLNETGTTVYVLALADGRIQISENVPGNLGFVLRNNDASPKLWTIQYYHVNNLLVPDGATVTTGQKIAEIVTGSGKAYLHLGAIERDPLRQRDFYRDVTGQSINTQSLWKEDNCPRFKEDIDAGVFYCLQRTYPESLATPSATPTATSTPQATYTPTGTPTPTPNFTATPSPTGTPTATPQPTATSSPTAVATFTPTGTPSPTPNFTPTPTPAPTGTPTPAQGTPVAIVCAEGGRVVKTAAGQQTCQYFANVPVVLNYTSGNQNIAITGPSTATLTSATADYRISATTPIMALR